MKKAKTEETEKEKSIGLFDVLSMIEGSKIEWNELDEGYRKAYSQFMINRFISSKEVYMPLIEKLSTMKLTDEQHYTILCTAISGNRKHYFDYKSYKKEKVGKDEDLLIFAISKQYEIGKREAKTYINKISETEKQTLITKWTDMYEQK